jgi:hypothetical protein
LNFQGLCIVQSLIFKVPSVVACPLILFLFREQLIYISTSFQACQQLFYFFFSFLSSVFITFNSVLYSTISFFQCQAFFALHFLEIKISKKSQNMEATCLHGGILLYHQQAFLSRDLYDFFKQFFRYFFQPLDIPFFLYFIYILWCFFFDRNLLC